MYLKQELETKQREQAFQNVEVVWMSIAKRAKGRWHNVEQPPSLIRPKPAHLLEILLCLIAMICFLFN